MERRLRLQAGNASITVWMGDVGEVSQMPELTRVPLAPAALAGLAGMRGVVVPVVSLARLLGSEAAAPPRRLVLLRGEEPIALAVDAVEQDRSGAGEATSLADLLRTAFAERPSAKAHRKGAPAAAAGPGAASNEDVGLLVFEVSGQLYGLPLAEVRGVIRPDKGVLDAASQESFTIEHQEQRIVVRRAAQILGLAPRAIPAHARIVFASIRGATAGLFVDQVRGIVRTSRTRLRAAPGILNRGGGASVRIEAMVSTEDGLVAVLSAEGLRDLPATREAAAPIASGASESAVPLLTFELADQTYALAATSVLEVLKAPEAGAIPPKRGGADGVMNRRGRALALVDPRARLGLDKAADIGRRRVLVIADEEPWGLLADAVGALIHVPAGSMTQTLPLTERASAIFQHAVRVEAGGRPMLVVDAGAVRRAAADGMGTRGGALVPA